MASLRRPLAAAGVSVRLQKLPCPCRLIRLTIPKIYALVTPVKPMHGLARGGS